MNITPVLRKLSEHEASDHYAEAFDQHHKIGDTVMIKRLNRFMLQSP